MIQQRVIIQSVLGDLKDGCDFGRQNFMVGELPEAAAIATFQCLQSSFCVALTGSKRRTPGTASRPGSCGAPGDQELVREDPWIRGSTQVHHLSKVIIGICRELISFNPIDFI